MKEPLLPGALRNVKYFMLGLKDFLVRPKIKSHKIIKQWKYYVLETKSAVEGKININKTELSVSQ